MQKGILTAPRLSSVVYILKVDFSTHCFQLLRVGFGPKKGGTDGEPTKPWRMTRILVPAALVSQKPFQKTPSNTFSAEAGRAKIVEGRTDPLGTLSRLIYSGLTQRWNRRQLANSGSE
jgi:hypothetical protein